MTDKIIKLDRITYRRLNQALTTLGFTRRQTDEFTAYSETKHDALIVLPPMSDQTFVGEPHLVAVRNTVALKGVASRAKLDSLLLPAGKIHTITVGGCNIHRASAKRNHRNSTTTTQGTVGCVKKKAYGQKTRSTMVSRKKKIDHSTA